MSNLTAIVTGAGRGIGRLVAEQLASNGYEVALLARSKDQLEEVSSNINRQGGKSLVIPCDITDENTVTESIKYLKTRWKNLGLLFNNAGVYMAGSAEISIDDFRKIQDVNVFGAWHILHCTVPWFKEQKSGTIINLASIAGNVGFAGVGAYCSSKFALRGLNESLHRELEPLGIRVTAISPSWVNTEMAAHSHVAPDKMIQPQDIADTVLYLMKLGSSVAVKEIVLGCRSDLV